MVLNWDEDHSKPCPYEVSEGEKEEDFFKKMQLKLAEEEHQQLIRGEAGHSSSITVFLVQGIELQEAQRNLDLFITTNKALTPTQQLELQKRRSSLLKRILHFRSLQVLLMPRLSDVLSLDDMKQVESPDYSHPEKIRLFLPSDCRTASARTRACVAGLPAAEARLREAEARDALTSVRDGLRARTATTRYKIRNVTGQVGSTRAGGVLRHIDIRIHSRKIRYRLARDCLLRLVGHGKWEEELRELKDTDITGLNERKLTEEEAAEREERRKRLGINTEIGEEDDYLEDDGVIARVQGESKCVLSWIWSSVSIEKGDDTFRDAVRVEWCKSRARMFRWKEEVMLLTEELRRMQHYAIWKAEWWMERRVGLNGGHILETISPELREGLDAYAWQQTSFQHGSALKIRERWGQLNEHAQKVIDRIPNLPTIYLELEDEEEDTSASRDAEQSM
ncbi:hypothetical protein K435DRAFT_814289 [Dendrothele bispora CBS 962.96]|uniref:Uncharacterized protein n=1 Tax=Dendrothele bispora (strain CBS 962.96) TaxID=1314807 RepID=A0A4S8KJG5_DENBC|nr:hypothetical protein K435DRAFT_814289 [Dendrothele bispora CBS 962.96]